MSLFGFGDKQGRSYSEWMSDLLNNPFTTGGKGICFMLTILPVMILCGIKGLSIFPSGRYPMVLLLIPGFILSGFVLAIYGWIVYKLPGILTIPVSLLATVIGCTTVYHFFATMFH